jgi:L-2-hydroxyglutarate oxidase
VIVATRLAQLGALAELERRAKANGLHAVRCCAPAELRAREPHAAGVAALIVDDTGIVDFSRVTEEFAQRVLELGGLVTCGAPVRGIVRVPGGYVLQTPQGEIRCRNLVNCAGLHSDRVARMCGLRPSIRIVPFRGEYHHLRRTRDQLVRHLIYPVPDPALPFLGAHFTRTITGTVEVGPNAVLALARHGYHWGAFSVYDAAETLAFPGFWRLAHRQWRTGIGEVHRSLSRMALVRSLRELIPALEPEDLESGGAGVRAQAVGNDGRLIEDFEFIEAEGALHVLNAPSPAATASLAIGRLLADRATHVFRASARSTVGWAAPSRQQPSV